MSESIKKTLLFIHGCALFALLLSPSLVSAVEGELENEENEENEEDELWAAALSLDRQGEAVRAIDAYNKLVDRFPDSENVSTAMERISALRAEMAAAERELFDQIKGEDDLETRISLCLVYVRDFPDGPHRLKVDKFHTAAKEELKKIEAEAATYARVVNANDSPSVIKWGNLYISTYPDGIHKTKVLNLLSSAHADIAAIKEHRESIGETQRVWGVALMVFGGTVGGAGGILGGVTKGQYDDLKSTCGDTAAGCSTEDRDNNHTKAVVTNWLIGAGVVSFVTGIIVYATAPSWEDEKPAVSAAVAPTPDGNGAVVGMSGRF